MYAINHAATALILKKKQAPASMWLLLLSVQLVEILWIIFNWLGVEHVVIIDSKLHLGFLPYSHSIFSALFLALLSFAIINYGYKNRNLAIAFAFGVMSHIILDII